MDFKLILAVTILLAVPFVTESGKFLELKIQTFILIQSNHKVKRTSQDFIVN